MKPLKLLRSEKALQDLEDIHLLIALDNPGAAERFLEAALRSFRTLCLHPELGPRYRSERKELAGLRFWPIRSFGSYLVFYQVDPKEESLLIVRLLHGARDIPHELQ